MRKCALLIALVGVVVTLGVSLPALRQVAIWADQVRESRNILHYQIEPVLPNTYEKVATLLLGAAPYLKVIYAVHDAGAVLAGGRRKV